MSNRNNNNPCNCGQQNLSGQDINMKVCGKNSQLLPMLQTYNTIVLQPNICCKRNILTPSMMSCEDTKYVIKWDFDLNGQTITVPERCILEFDGGTLKNGTIIGQDTVYINVGDVDIWGENLTREGTWREHSGGGGCEEDKPYDPEAHSGLGRKTLQLKDGSNILTQEDFDQANTIYVVGYDFDLGDVEEKTLSFTSSNVSSVKTPERIKYDIWVEAHPDATPEQKAEQYANVPQDYYYYAEVPLEAKHALHLTGRAVRLNNDQSSIIAAENSIVYAENDTVVYVGCLAGQYSYRYDNYITVPQNCALGFDGGSINNGTIVLDDTYIISDYKCFDSTFLDGTLATTEVHLVWIDYTDHECLQALVDFAVSAEKDINLDAIEFDVNDCLFIDRRVDVMNTWMTIHNGTININTPHLFKTRFEVNEDPLSQYVILKDIVFNNSTNDEVDVFYDNHFLRIKAEGCKFRNVTIANTEKYLQTYYITGCLVFDLEHNLIKAHKVYDLHFINNSVERSNASDVIFVNAASGLFVMENLIESVNIAVRWSWGIGITIVGNYFEACHEVTLKSVNTTDNVATGTTIVGNHFARGLNDIFPSPDYIYYFMDLGAAERDFVIQGNGIVRYEAETEEEASTHKTQDVRISHCLSYGLYLPATSGATDANKETGMFPGSNNINTITRSLVSDKVQDDHHITLSAIDHPGFGLKVPKTYLSDDFPFTYDDVTHNATFDDSTPHNCGARRVHLEQSKIYYDDNKTDCFWKSTMMDSRKPYVPWIYIMRQTAEDMDNYNAAVAAWERYRDEHPTEDPGPRPDPRRGNTGWIKLPLMLDKEWGLDYIEDTIGEAGSYVEFDDDFYYNGLLRVHPRYGLQFFAYRKWHNASSGKAAAYKVCGPTTDRPALEDHSDYTSASVYAGFMYFDTTINKPVFFCGSDKASGASEVGYHGWVDANGENPYPTNDPNAEI